ncbi:uridine kinase [Natronosporangium hydrolyticum]|uniref:Uridine kinase n=1 Tax=Natronosporangium hydrolyticum TaxID=2811111 RepID=A0A895Y4L8_9ACTN|nr:uridine kinase [Natronosporangium hydrolyticum]QSB12637.1 uridine kinase [Natronosporangium hydrolyticum]
MTAQARPRTPAALIDELADRIAATRPGQRLRVAIDGAPAAEPDALADALIDPVRVRGRDARVIRTDDFLRPASLRLELGRTNPDSFYERWLDDSGLRREVLSRLGPDGDGEILPTLWDAHTDRATRAAYQPVPAGGVVLVSGALLLGGLPFDLTIHLALSAAALARRTAPDQQWTLPAYARYEAEVGPDHIADVVVRADDPRHPAIMYPA